MRVRREPSFNRDIRRVRDQSLLDRVNEKIAEIEAAPSIREVSNVRRMNTSDGNHYRIRVGDHRIGITLEGDVVELHRVLPRDQIYRRFP